MLQLNDKATALMYEALTGIDQWLEVPPDRKNECKCKAYIGWLSNITESAAERYVKSGGNLLRAKTASEIDTSKVAEVIANKEE